LSAEGLRQVGENGNIADVKTLARKALDVSSVENEGYIQLLWTVSLHPVPASLFISCWRCGNVEEKVLLAAYFVFLTKSVISHHVRS